jgi:hypothetical protein
MIDTKILTTPQDELLVLFLQLESEGRLELAPLMKSYFRIVINDGYYERENSDLLNAYIHDVICKNGLESLSSIIF